MNTTVNNMNLVHVSWDEVPEEYEWFAIDESGNAYTYTQKPDMGVIMWNQNYGEHITFDSACYSGHYEDWKETLQQRPKKTIEISVTQEEKSFEMSLQRVGDMANLQISGKLSKEQIIKIMEVVYES